MKYKFEVMEQDWHKRRVPTETKKVLTAYEVTDFEKISGHCCTMDAIIDGVKVELNARVYCNERHTMHDDGSMTTEVLHWGVQGTDPFGTNVVLRLI